MRTSYKKEDVTLLLKDITGMVKPQSTKEREKEIQSGRHYCEMLPIEYRPSLEYMKTYEEALKNYSKITALAIGNLADKIIEQKGENVAILSLARAGIPIGILVKRYIKWKYKVDVNHYSISIIRGKGIDKNAINYVLKKHKAKDLLFLDGWIGKGAILKELKKDVKEFEGVSSELAVVADPANETKLCGTYEDILIPSSCLNSTISGLVSRTFLRDDIIKENDFHGAVYYGELKEEDLSYQFIEEIQKNFEMENKIEKKQLKTKGIDEVKKIASEFEIGDINLIKPGIGETTRVLLRRVPWKILINENMKDDISLGHIKTLAKEKGVAIKYYPLTNYKACGIIKKVSDV